MIILGAGLSGLAAGIKIKAPILEATDHAGGICREYERDGFRFSAGGGHWFFGNGPGLEFARSLVDLDKYDRKASVYYNTLFPYPFQSEAQKLITLNNDYSMRYWLFQKFGQEQCNLFFFPFNEKYTAGLYDHIVQADDYKSPPAGGSGFCSCFYNPKAGLNALIDAMGDRCEIHYQTLVTKIDVHNKVVYAGGKAFSYSKLVSTIPLNRLLEVCGFSLINLPYTSVLVLNIGAEADVNTPADHWVYVPFCKTGFYRVGFYSNVIKGTPEGQVSLSVEMAFYNTNFKDLDIEDICFRIIDELQSWRWIGKVIVSDPTWVPVAYTWNYDLTARQRYIDILKKLDIYSIGRYGKWHFQGMVQSIEEGLNVDKCYLR